MANPHPHFAQNNRTVAPSGRVHLDRLDEIDACLSAINDLLDPCMNLNAVDRSDLSTLLSFIQREQQSAREQLILSLSLTSQNAE